MSEWGDIVSALETDIRAAIPTLPAGDSGFERADDVGEDLSTGEFPHVYVRLILETTENPDVAYGAADVTVLLTFALWTENETQEEVSARLDAIDTQIATDRTLGGVVDRATIVARQISEFGQRINRRAEFLVQVEFFR